MAQHITRVILHLASKYAIPDHLNNQYLVRLAWYVRSLMRQLKLLEAAMLKLSVYYHGVLRYTIVANMEKAQALRNKGFYVLAKPSA
jgi:hypothetical protein